MKDKDIDWVKYGTYITGSIFFVAIIRLSIIGNRFGIPIGSFINFPNLIAYSAQILHPLTYPAILTSLAFIIYKALEPKNRTKMGLRKASKITIFLLIVFYFIPLFVLIYYLYFNIKGELGVERFLVGSGYVFLASVYVFFKRYCKSVNHELLLGTLLFGFLFFFAKVETKNEVYLITCKKVYKGSKILFNSGDSLISDSSRYFIASTLDFVFFYNEKDQQTLIYPQRDIKKIVFSSAVLPR